MAALEPRIALHGIAKSFDGGRSFAVCDLTMAVPAKAFVAIVGASGSGKTTALKTINRLIEPDRGVVRIDGDLIENSDAAKLRRQIGYVFQGIGLFPHMTVAENIGITPRLLGWPATAIKARVSELLELIGLPREYSLRAPRALSGGEQQRVGVARAIAARPGVVLMDEPFGALDPVTRDALGSAYRALHESLGLTTLMVTHDVQEAMLLADRIAVMKAGRLLAYDTPGALLGHANPDVAALLGMPKRQAERIRALAAANAGPTGHG